MLKKMYLLFIVCSVSLFAGYYAEKEIGQDKFVNEHFFKDRKKGFFIDIGAHEGVFNSNSYYFEKLGWDGICFEPDPRSFAELKKVRNCILYNFAVGSEEKVENFIQHPCSFVSGLDRTYEKQHRKVFRVKDGSRYFIPVQVVRLNDILKKHGIKHVDFLSIDTEGAEEDIIASIDFDEVYFDVIVLENNYFNPFFKKYLDEKGFEYVTTLHRDEVYVNKKRKDL
ncbi:MAG: hypothetical protein S4CHLAM20_01340 [Chlamydiia bacterium]|nr:hypothetical protein [Chlamydiia bacterium]